MRATTKALADVRARDVMQNRVITLPPEASIREAVETMQDAAVTGLAVVDTAGTVVGVLSARDIARREHLEGDRVSEDRGTWELSNPIGEAFEEEAVDDVEFTGREDYSPEVLGRETVGDWMTTSIVRVSPDATLGEVCKTMIGEGIHRVLVMEGPELVGLVSTMDIVKYLAKSL